MSTGYRGGGYNYFAKPKAKVKVAPRQPPPLTPAQIVAQQLAPVYQALDQAEKQRQKEADLAAYTSTQTTRSYMNDLAGLAGPAQQTYTNALGQTEELARNAAGLLRDSNPNAQLQAGLKAIGAPEAQQQQIAQENQANFAGAGASLYTREGAIPGADIAAQGLAESNYLRNLPGVAALAGERTLGDLLHQSQGQHQGYIDQRAQVAAKAPGLLQDVLAQQSRAQADEIKQAQLTIARNRQLALEEQTLGLKTEPRPNSSLSKTFGYVVDQFGNPIPDARGRTIPVATTAKPDTSGRPNAALSKVFGYIVDSNGNPVGGVQIPVYQKPAKPPKGSTPAERHTKAVANRGKLTTTVQNEVLGIVNKKAGTQKVKVPKPGYTRAEAQADNQWTTKTVPIPKTYDSLYKAALALPDIQVLKRKFNYTDAQIRQLIEEQLGKSGYYTASGGNPKKRPH